VIAEVRTGVVVRPMRWWDVETVAAHEAELFADTWTPSMFWTELAGVPATRFYVVAESVGPAPDVVGYAGLYIVGGDADIQTVAVIAARQGEGIGGVLLDSLLDEARRRDCARVTLEVRSDNEPAHALYVRRGFERIGVRRGYYPPDGADADVMQLRLRGGSSVRIGLTP